MSNGLESRIERLTEQLRPEPGELVAVVLRQFTPIPEDAILCDGFYRVGQFGIATFLGGTPKEKKLELRRLRASGEYDKDPCGQRAISEDEVKAINEGERL